MTEPSVVSRETEFESSDSGEKKALISGRDVLTVLIAAGSAMGLSWLFVEFFLQIDERFVSDEVFSQYSSTVDNDRDRLDREISSLSSQVRVIDHRLAQQHMQLAARLSEYRERIMERIERLSEKYLELKENNAGSAQEVYRMELELKALTRLISEADRGL